MSKLIETVTAFITEKNCPVYSLSVISDKYGQETVKFLRGNRCQNSYSVAKAFVVTAVGIAHDRGLMTVDDKITDILAEYVPDGIDPRWHSITVRDALLHRMGLPSGFLDIDVAPAGKFGTDYLNYMFTYPFEQDPCVRYVYTDGAYYLLSRAVEKAVGEPIDSLLWRELFSPLNFYEMAWSRCPQGHPMGATGLYIAASDMVKLGEVYRKGGVFGGRRIISEEWVNTVLSEGFELRRRESIGAYGKGGMKGQDLCVFPEKGLSVAWHAYDFRNKDELLKLIAETEL